MTDKTQVTRIFFQNLQLPDRLFLQILSSRYGIFRKSSGRSRRRFRFVWWGYRGGCRPHTPTSEECRRPRRDAPAADQFTGEGITRVISPAVPREGPWGGDASLPAASSLQAIISGLKGLWCGPPPYHESKRWPFITSLDFGKELPVNALQFKNYTRIMFSLREFPMKIIFQVVSILLL